MKSSRKLSSIFLCLLMVTVVFAATLPVSAVEVYPDGMVSFWRLDEESGGTATDSVNGNDGTLVTSETGPQWTTGHLGGALEFDGVNDRVAVGTVGAPIDLTVGAWFLHTTVDNKDRIAIAAEIGPDGWLMDFRTDGAGLRFVVGDGNGYSIAASNNLYTDGNWHFVVGVQDSTANTVSLFVDGSEVDSSSGSYVYSAIALDIGASREWGNHFQGKIDEVFVCGRALDVEEISDLWNNGLGSAATPDGDTLALWHFDEVSGKVATDSSTNDHDGALLPDSPAWTTGQVGGALSFDGVGGYVSIGTVGAPQDLTVAAWFQHTSVDDRDRLAITMENNDGWLMDFRTDSRGLRFAIGDGVTTSTAKSGNLYTDGVWHLAIGVQDTTANVVKLYVDGVEVDSTAGSYSYSDRTLEIGASGEYGNYFQGKIDEVAIWDVALTANEVQNHYINGLTGKSYCFVPPDEALDELFDDVDVMDIPEGQESSLVSSLDNALDTLESGNDKAAANIVNAFIYKVEAQRGKKLLDDQATLLTEAADAILAEI
jgi:hypothetical protein